MFPTGLGEVIVTPPLALPPGRDLAPDLVLGLALCDVFRLLDLPMLAPSLYQPLSMPSFVTGASLIPAPRASERSFDGPANPSAYGAAAGGKSRARHGAACGLSRACGSVQVNREASSRSGSVVSVTPGQRVRHAAEKTLLLHLLPVALPLCLPGVLLCLIGPLRLG